IGKRLAPPGGGIIFRTAAEGIEERELQADFALLAKLWKRAETKSRHCPPRTIVHRDMPLTLKLVREFFNDDVDRFIIDSSEEYKGIIEDCEFLSPFQRAAMELYEEKTPLFEKFGVENEIRRALDFKVTLPSGAYLFIERTEALNSIDVNSGRFSGGADLQETVFKVNLEAAREIARQIRLRNLSGMIIIDFIDLDDPRHRKEVVKVLKDCLKGDRNRPNIYDMSELGLVQMTRRRASASLHEVLKTPCRCCAGRGRVLSPLTLANRIRTEVLGTAQQFECERIRVRAHPDVVEFFNREQRTRAIELEQRAKRPLDLVPEADRVVETYTIEAVLANGSVIDRTPEDAKRPSSSERSEGDRSRPSGSRGGRSRKPLPNRTRRQSSQRRSPRKKHS
ncbi:MAG TPA: ribonuclease E/G, partial [Candidatus Ozemobacteraceae bacterium]|nr:ribonuclease E/G [Candidatus Ozemobacteraceae bacterium]